MCQLGNSSPALTLICLQTFQQILFGSILKSVALNVCFECVCSYCVSIEMAELPNCLWVGHDVFLHLPAPMADFSALPASF